MRLIDADDLKESIKRQADILRTMGNEVLTEYTDVMQTGFCQEIDNAPTIEPERKKGKWQWLSSTYDRTPCEMRYMCSECHHETILHSNGMSHPWEKFCPNCGADMRGEQE